MDALIEVQYMPKAGETIMGRECLTQAGGKGANQAYAAGKLGVPVAMIGKVGADAYGEALIDNLKRAGVEVSGIEISKNFPTGRAFVMLEQNGENRIVVIPGANQDIQPEMITRHNKLLDACDVVVMQLEIPLDVVVYAAKEAKKRGKLVILDPAPASRNLPNELLKNVDIIKPNETELSEISGVLIKTKEEMEFAASELLKRGVRAVVATRGEKGVFVAAEGYQEYFSAEKVPVVDTTAAGDSFTSALASFVSKERFREAVLFANRVASYTVQKKGAQASLPSINEIKMPTNY